jgi:hypothetical protein
MEKIMTRHLLNKLPFVSSALAVLLGLTLTAHGSVPSMEVTVFDANGKVAFKAPMSANATFATRNLLPGDYVVQFNTRSATVKDNQYLLVVAAGKKKVIADSVPGAKFTGGGAAMKIRVGPDTRITGQVVDEQPTAQGDGPRKYRVVNGQRFVWVTTELGSNQGGHWVEESLAPARNVIAWKIDDFRNRMDRGGEGSMIPHAYPTLVAHGY